MPVVNLVGELDITSGFLLQERHVQAGGLRMLHALEGVLLDQLPDVPLAADDRSARESQLFR